MDNERRNDESPRAPRRKEIKAARAQKQTVVRTVKSAAPKVDYSRKAMRRARRKENPLAWYAAPVTAASLCLLIAVLVFSGSAIWRWQKFREARAEVAGATFYKGITVDGVDMSGTTLHDALSAWGEREARQREACQVELHIDDDTWLLTAKDMGYSSDHAQVLQSAYSIGRYGSFATRLETVQKTAGAWGRDFKTSAGCDQTILTRLLEQIATQASEPAVEAGISGFSEAGGFTFTQGRDGMVVDVHELKDAVEEAIRNGGGQLTVERKKVSPGRTVEDLKKLFGKISQAKTNARSSSANRLVNLRLACSVLNGLCIQPGEVFSFNEALGKRTTDKGYKNAPALSSGSHTMQIGGGICQVATTLFNAVAKADMGIVKRYPHSIPSSYVARGLDATVNWPNQDFQFKNTSDYPIYLSASVNSSKQVLISVYGRLLDEGVTIKLKAMTNETYAPGEPEVVYTDSLEPGQQQWISDRRSGYKVTTYRIHYKNGVETDSEQLFKSSYAASRGKVRVGR